MSENNWLNEKINFYHIKTRWLLYVIFICVAPTICSLYGIDFGSYSSEISKIIQSPNNNQVLATVQGTLHHTILEWSAVSTALIAALVSFFHYSIRKDITVPIVGCALMCAAFMDAFHILAATRILDATANLNSFVPFAWALSRTCHAIIMIIGVGINIWLYQHFKVNAIEHHNDGPKFNWRFIVSISMTLLLFSYFIIDLVANNNNLPITIYPDAQIKRPFDMLPLGLFIFAATLFWLWYQQDGKKNQLKFIFVLSIIPEIATQLHMAFGSIAIYDHHFNIAQFLKLFAYACILIGLIIDISDPSQQIQTDINDIKQEKLNWHAQQNHKGVLDTGIAKHPISVQLPMVAFLLASSVAIVVSFSFYFESERILQKQEVEDLGVETNLIKPLIAELYQQAYSDLLFLSNTAEIHDIMAATQDQNSDWQQASIQELQYIFSTLLDNKSDYLKISFVNKDYHKPLTIGVERNLGGVVSLPTSHLEHDEYRTQLLQATKMSPKSIYFSKISLRKKYQQVLNPHQPILEVLTPIFNQKNGELFALLALEVDFTGFIDRLKSNYLTGLNLYIANAQGDFIYHPEQRFTFGFDLGKRYRIQDQFPDLYHAIKLAVDSQGFNRLNTSAGEIQAGYYRVLDMSRLGSDKPLILFLTPDNYGASAELQTFRYRSLLIGITLAFVALAFAVLSSRRVVQPLTEMTIGVQNYERTGRLPELPIKSTDEFGVLARSFHNLLFRVTNALEMQKRSATRLQDTTDKLESILSSAADAIVTIDNQGNILSFNTAAETIFGYEQEQVIGQNVRLLMPERDKSTRVQTIQHIMGSDPNGNTKVSRELIGLRSSNEEFPMHLAISEVNSSTGKIITCIIRDISIQKQDEASINRTLSLLKSILESTDNGILVTDSEGYPIHHNSRFAQMWGVTDDLIDISNSMELRTHMIKQLTNPNDYNIITDKLLSDHLSESNEVIVFKDGRLVERTSRPMMVAHETDGRIWSFRDITLAKQTEQVLIEAKEEAENIARYKSEFLASMSHEIRTPMNGVLGMLGLLQHSQLNETQTHHAQLARSSAESLLTIINDILDFSKVEAGKLNLEIIEYNLSSQLGDFAESIAHRAQEKNLELILDVTGIENTTVKGDPGRLRQILNNLVGNALKFTHQGEITITAKLQETDTNKMRLDCRVKDTGIGIEQEKLEILFESFTQVDASTTREYGGTGLGLAIVKQLCHLMQGDVWVNSEIGKGSEFGFYIILEKSEHSTNLLPTVDINNLRLLIVDNNNTNRQMMCRQLQLWGAKITEANNANEALSILDRYANKKEIKLFSAIYIDMEMPNVSGLELGSLIRSDSRFDQVQMVMMTSMSNRGDAKRFSELGFCAYFPKPVTTSDLFDSLAQVISSNQSLEQSPSLMAREYLKALKQQNTKNQYLINLPSQVDILDKDLPSTDILSAITEPDTAHQLFAPNTQLLLVEDNFINQTVALAQLKQLGLKCDVAINGLEALDLLRAAPSDSPYELIFMDCQMPELDGYEATQKIRAGLAGNRYQHTPIIAMTANAMEGDREKCLLAGMSDYMSKPISPMIIEQRLKYWLLNQQ